MSLLLGPAGPLNGTSTVQAADQGQHEVNHDQHDHDQSHQISPRLTETEMLRPLTLASVPTNPRVEATIIDLPVVEGAGAWRGISITRTLRLPSMAAVALFMG